MPEHVPAHLPDGYPALLDSLKQRIQAAQARAVLAVNRELIALYWEIGREIATRQEAHGQTQGWGDGILDRVARDLKAALPGVEGFSRRNLYRMRAFYLAYRTAADQGDTEASPESPAFVPQLVAQIPWGHNALLLEKLRDTERRLWYAARTAEHGWSRAVLAQQIESRLHERQGQAVTNFARTLPPPQSDLARQALKDPYNFDFLTLGDDAHERHLERGLVAHIRQFLLELGVGFAFVGSQYHLQVSDQDFYLDLLFYHLRLRCFVVIDLKMRAFTPEDAGKMNFYLSAVDDLLRHEGDAPSIGLILCKTRDAVIAEYALRGNTTPIGVAEFRITEALPDDLRSSLPTVEEIEAEFAGDGTPGAPVESEAGGESDG